MKKIKEEVIKEQLLRKGYKVIGEYINTNTPVECIQLKTNYKVMVKYTNLCDTNKTPTVFGKSNPYYKENMNLFLKNKNPNVEVLNIEDIVKSKRKRTLLTLKCECGNIFKMKWDDAKNNKYLCCNHCSTTLRGKNRRANTQETIDYIHSCGYKILQHVSSITRDSKILVENADGYRGYTTYSRLHSGKGITIFSANNNKKNFIYNINNYAKLNGINTRAIEFSNKEKWTRQGIKFVCECGQEFETSIASFQNGKIRCDDCSKKLSRYENIVQVFLKENNIDYISEFKFNSCKDILPLPFDFYLKDYKKIIEVDGEQHFTPCCFGGISEDVAKINFDTLKKHDIMKNNFCNKNNIPLLRLPYNEIKSGIYKERIMQFIKE